MHATDIVGYAFQADMHCVGCMWGIAMAHIIPRGDGRTPVDVDTETLLAEWASVEHIDTNLDQDTGVYPSPVFMDENAYDVDGPTNENGEWRPRKCGTCFEPLF